MRHKWIGWMMIVAIAAMPGCTTMGGLNVTPAQIAAAGFNEINTLFDDVAAYLAFQQANGGDVDPEKLAELAEKRFIATLAMNHIASLLRSIEELGLITKPETVAKIAATQIRLDEARRAVGPLVESEDIGPDARVDVEQRWRAWLYENEDHAIHLRTTARAVLARLSIE